MKQREVLEEYISGGILGINRNIFKTFLLSILAGIFIAIGAYSYTIANTYFESMGRLLGAMVFPIGIILVSIAGSELFTGDCLLIIPYLDKKIPLGKLLKFLLIVYIGNFIGSIIFALLNFSVVSDEFAKKAVEIALLKVSKPSINLFILGITCNFLVCLGIWMSLFGEYTFSRGFSLYISIMIFVFCGFEHSIANMYYIPMGLFLKGFTEIDTSILNWSSFIFTNLIPVTLGNILGGTLVGTLYYYIYKNE